MSSPPPPSPSSPSTLPERLRADLTAALRAREQSAVRALRSVLAAIANAEAPALDHGGPPPSYGRLVDHARLELGEADHQRVLRAEIEERRAAAAAYAELGVAGAAGEVQAQLAVLLRYAG